MEYRKFGDIYLIRLDPGEEIVEKIQWLCLVEQIHLAHVSGLGAVNNVTLGIFNPDTKQYKANMFHADFEIVSLTGTVTTKEGRPYLHLHMAVGDTYGRCYGGHLNSAVVSATCEIVLTTIPGTVERKPDPAIGLNLMHFYPSET